MSGNVSKDSEKGKAAESVDKKDAAEEKTEVKVAEPELTVEDGERHPPRSLQCRTGELTS